jgi:hypothetical protein
MFCCGLDPNLAVWMAENQDDFVDDDLRLAPLAAVATVWLTLVLMAAMAYGHQ